MPPRCPTALLLLPACLAAWPGSASAGGSKADAVQKYLAEDDYEGARRKCTRWDAEKPSADEALRAICAKAYWPLTARLNSPEAWAEFRETWAGTTSAEQAHEQEAALTLARVAVAAPEARWVELAERYAGTESEAGFRKGAARAAVRDARTPDAAREAARLYPDEPTLPSLVEQYPDVFLQVDVTGREVRVRVDPPVPLEGALEPRVAWVAADGAGNARPWDEAMREYLERVGLPKTFLDSFTPPEEGGPAFPLCASNALPDGWRPTVEVTVGRGRLLTGAAWDQGCAPTAPPAFLLAENKQLVGASLAPGHLLDLGETRRAYDGRWHIASLIRGSHGKPFVVDGAIYQPLGNGFIAWPLSGGMPWVTLKQPGPRRVPLTEIRGAPLPGDWKLVHTELGLEAASTSGANIGIWPLGRGDAVVLTPLVQKLTGLSAAESEPPANAAPALDALTPWRRQTGGIVDRLPPTGGKAAGIYSMTPGEVAQCVSTVVGVGVPREKIDSYDGYRIDLDTDGVEESVVRVAVDDKGALAVCDPIEGRVVTTAADARVFMWESDRVIEGNHLAGTPFPFRFGEHVYLAWSGQEIDSAGRAVNYVEVVRSDGTGFTSDAVFPP